MLARGISEEKNNTLIFKLIQKYKWSKLWFVNDIFKNEIVINDIPIQNKTFGVDFFFVSVENYSF